MKLTETELREALATLPDWAPAEGRVALRRGYKFKDFREAFAFMTQVALTAERMDHHPDWTNVYNRVEVTLTTHDAQGLTQSDIRLARYMDHAASRFLVTG